MIRTALTAALLCAGAAQADEMFVEANVLGIFYHELGHALIDIEGVPIFGQEEDAADVFSIFLIDALFEEDAAQSIAYDAAFGFAGEVEMREQAGEEVAWWDVHGPDEQRYYNTVCIFYGADPDKRADLAEELGLPEDRAEYCPDEYDQAAHSWGAVLDEMAERGAGKTLSLEGEDGSLTAQLLAQEIRDLNAVFSLSAPLTVTLESCGEANAFYDPETTEIIMCTEFEDHIREMAK
ncbi:MAG: hypothetical protein CSA72_00710 [Rhodobacterales bacterium]|nr:MAG: hypothetical protein CSA72_00710 [Rhodobacterales bacterium]